MRRRRVGLAIRGFVTELRRRRVPRVFVAYAVAAVAIAEGADLFFPTLGVGPGGVELVTVLAMLGLPVALLLAWAFDIVPDATPPTRLTDTSAGVGVVEPDSVERWQAVQNLFARALTVSSNERITFVTNATLDDEALRGEVLSLLQAHEGDGPLEALEARLSLGSPGRAVGELEGTTVLHYELLEKLDDGGMGIVYRARDTRLGRTVALKFLSPVLLADRRALERFSVEAQAAASLDHPNLCTIHEVGETEDGLHFIAMAYYEGGSLRHRIRRGAVGVDQTLVIAAQICGGLARAAEQGIVHRDIKPANIMFAGDGSVKIVDFGLAKVGGGELTRSGALMGTVAYMSPEQARGEALDQRTDIWSTGVVLYEMLSGVRPFRGGNDQAVIQAILTTEPEPLNELVPGLPPGVIGMVERALEKDPARRYLDASSLLSDVQCLIEDPDHRALAGMKPRLPADGERRMVTVLAGVVSGFDELLDSAGASGVGEELIRLRTWIEGVMEEYGGVVHEFSEHGVTALFGIPVSHEDDGLRAVRSARQLVSGSRRGESVAASFELRFAVASELVPVSRSSTAHRAYRIGGSVVRDAMLIAASGREGDVLVTPESLRGVAPLLVTEERSAVSLSTDQSAVTPLAVVRESDVDSGLDVSRSRGLSLFVGRGDEVGTLAKSLDAAARGVGGVVTIVGDAGVGKSRLLHEFRGSLADDGIPYVQGRCQSHRMLAPYTPFIECARVRLGLQHRTAELSEPDIAARAKALAPHLEAYAPVLRHLLSSDSNEQVLGSFSAEEKAAAAVEVLTSLFTLGSGGKTLVLLLEDWQWADDGSDTVLRHLAEMVSAHPVMVVVTSRSEIEAVRALPTGLVQLDLHPLDSAAATALAASSLGRVRMHPELARHVETRAGGNPFFIEELCEHLVETKGLDIRDGQARLADGRDHSTIPGTIRAVLRSRLDRLDPESREVLRTASVIGRDFGTDLLSRVVPSPIRLPGTLRLLRYSGLIQRTSLIPEERYRFKHALSLDVAYGSLLERQRRERHAIVGEAIEDLHDVDVDEWLDPLARHFSEAGDWERAVRYGVAAAARAGRLWRWREAVSTLERVEGWMAHRGDEDGGEATLVELLFAKEEYLEGLDRREEQAETIRRLEELVPSAPSRSRAMLLARQIGLLTLSDRLDEAGRVLAELTDVAEQCGVHDERAHALRVMGISLRRLGRANEAVGPLTELLDYSRAHAAPDVLLRDLWTLGNVHVALGHVAAAESIAAELRVLEPKCSPLEQGMLHHFMGRLYRSLGEPEQALEAYRLSSERHELTRLGELAPVRKSMHLLAVAALQVEMGEMGDAMETYGEALDLARRSTPDHLARALTIKAELLAGLDRPGDALPLYREAVEILEMMDTDVFFAEVLGRFAEVLEAARDEGASDAWRRAKQVSMEIGDGKGAVQACEREARLSGAAPDRQRELLQEALRMTVEQSDPQAEARVRNSLALLSWREEDLAGACGHYQAAARQLERPEDVQQLGVVLNGWGAALARAGRLDEAERVLSRALETNRSAEAIEREADSLSALGSVCRSLGDDARAGEYYRTCVEKRREAEDRVGEGWALHRLAELARSAGAADRGAALDARALSIARETGDDALVTSCARTNQEI